MVKSNPICGCGDETICNEVELQCDPCCRCIPLRLCAVFHAYGCECDGNSDLLEIDINYEYIGAILCGDQTLDLLVYIYRENELCYWRVVSEAFSLDERFLISPEAQSCEKPILEFEVPFEECTGTVRIERHELERLDPRVDDYCEEEPWCGTCECVCKVLCVTRREAGQTVFEELEWDEYTHCWGDICLTRDEESGECVVTAEGYEPVTIMDCGLGLTFTLHRGYDTITAYCKECGCRVCVGCCFPTGYSPTGELYLKDLEWEISAPECYEIDGARGIFHPVDPTGPIDGKCGYCATYQNVSDAPQIAGQIPGLPLPDPYQCGFSPCGATICFELCCVLENASGTDDPYDDCCHRLKLKITSSAFQLEGPEKSLSCQEESSINPCDGGQIIELSPISCVCDPQAGLSAIFDLSVLGFGCDQFVQDGPCEGEPDCCMPFACSFSDAFLYISVKP